MNGLVNIQGTDISIKEYKGQRVVTFKDIDAVHHRPEGTARRNFAANKERFIEGKHFFRVTPEILANTAKNEFRTSEPFEANNKGTALITERGYLLLVKSFTDDLAWEVQERLVECYFQIRTSIQDMLPQTYIEALEQLLESAKENERLAIANKELEEEKKMNEPKVLFADSVVASEDSILVRDLAKLLKQNGIEIGEKRLYARLREEGYICKYGTEPTQKAMELGLFERCVRTVQRGDLKPLETMTTRVSSKGQIYFINRYLKGDKN